MMWVSVILLPMLLAGFSRWRPESPWVTALLCGGAGLPALALGFGWVAPGPQSFDGVLLVVEFGLDTPRRILLALAAVLWTTGGFFAAGNLAGQPRVATFRCFFLLSMAGNLGLILAEDAAGFYTLFALMTFAAYGLVIHSRSANALRAGKIYLIMAIFGELLLIAAIYAAVSVSGSINLAEMAEGVWQDEWRTPIYALAIAGFGVKVGIVPLYFWLPLAHPVAPTPASAILSGSMLKAGLLGWLHFSPVLQGGAPGWILPLAVLGLAATFGAVLIGLFQTDAKTNLAYSSISQMGVLTVFFALCHAAGAPVEWLLPALALYAWNHGIAKGALFLGVGVAQAGGIRARPWIMAGLALAALSIAGLPLTGGALTKGALKDAVPLASSGLADWLPALLVASSFFTTLLLGRFLYLCAQKPHETQAVPGRPWQTGAWLSLLGILLVGTGGWFMRLLPDYPVALDLEKAVAAAAPILLGAGLLFGWHWARRAKPARKVPVIPPGDGVVLFEWLGRAILRTWRGRIQPLLAGRVFDVEKNLHRLLGIEQNALLADSGERHLGHWNSVGIAFFITLLIFIFTLRG